MKKIYLLLMATLAFSPLTKAAQGGPDAYGYTWMDSNEPGGPTFNWIDITPSGNVVNGLLDDNSVAFVPIGIDFHYYWGDYNQVKIGSNGWVSFDNTGNIAHCFPTIPTAGGASDNYLAPFMTDLNFDVVGNPAYCMYHYVLADSQFVISYLDVGWWSPNAPGYVGSNSFQIILDAKDSSITYQYLITDAANFNDMVGCATDNVIGMEGPTGAFGLQVYQDSIPPAGYAVKFYYPNPVLIDVPDITPNWAMNTDNGGEFHFDGQNVTIPVNIKNVGNIDVNTDINVTTDIVDQFFTTVATFNSTIVGGLTMGNDTTLQYNWTPAGLGQYSLEISVTNVDDINATNDQQVNELEIQDPNPVPNTFSYINPGQTQSSSLSWNSGNDDGVGTRFIPNSYPVVIDSIGGFCTGVGDVRLDLYADDGPNNMPGTLLHSETFLSGSVPLNAWVISTLATPDTIYSGGFYVVWIQANGSTAGIGTVLTPPYSRRNVELVTDWAVYRDNADQEFMLEAWAASLCATLSSTSTFQAANCAGEASGSIDLTVVGGFAPFTYSWTGGADPVEDPTGLLAGSYTVTITDSVGCQHNETIIVTEPLPLDLSAVTTDEILGNDGSIDLTVTGGVGPYGYNWTMGAGSNEDPNGLAGGTYTVTVTDQNFCTDTLTVVVNSQLGIDENPFSFKVFPNPTTGLIMIQSNIAGNDLIITIEDISGRVTYFSNFIGNSMELDLRPFAEGAYFIRLSDGEHEVTKKIILNK